MEVKNVHVISPGETVPDDYRGPLLRLDRNGLCLVSAALPDTGPTRVDFLDRRIQRRLQTSRRGEGVAKAIGLDKMASPYVLDATAGLGVDAYIMAAMGCRVTLLEKSAVMAALLKDGLRRAAHGDIASVRETADRMTLHHLGAREYLQRLDAGGEGDGGRDGQRDSPDVIYLDPMFPPRKKSAKVKKDMALLQTLLEPNEDIDELLSLSRRRARKRVVLKRPGRQAKITASTAPKPDFQVPGKSCHFQVFLCG